MRLTWMEGGKTSVEDDRRHCDVVAAGIPCELRLKDVDLIQEAHGVSPFHTGLADVFQMHHVFLIAQCQRHRILSHGSQGE